MSAGVLAAAHVRVGHAILRLRDLFRPRLTLGVRLMAFDDRGRVFLVRHSYLPGWHLPGGAVDPHETCRGAAVREAAEEGGLVLAAPPALFGVYANPAGGRHDHVLLYVARDARQPAPRTATLEIRAAAFHPVDPLPENVTRATRARLVEVLDGLPPAELW